MTVTANISPFWATPMADYVNPQLARELKEYVLTKEAQGIESGVAEFIKHNLTESAFDFFHSDDPVIQKLGRYPFVTERITNLYFLIGL